MLHPVLLFVIKCDMSHSCQTIKLYLSCVRKFAGILFIAIHLFTFAEFQNVLKLPVLFEHYGEHKKSDPDMGFWSFIKLHYLDPFTTDQDYERDRQLPFQSTVPLLITSVSLCECPAFVLDIYPAVEISKNFYHFNDNTKPQFSSFDIFQPPRCA